MSTVRDLARAHGHWLTPDVPAADNATLGGVIAAGQSGFDRVRHGPVRHHVLGATAVMADGTLAKSGGRLVKNVTGFDLQRLWCGSHGTLCFLVEATLRLCAAPRAEIVVTVPARDAREVRECMRAVAHSSLRPIALVASADDHSAWTLHAHLGGLPDAVEHERRLLAELWGDVRTFTGADARAEAERVRELDPAAQVRPWFHVTCPPAHLERALALDFTHDSWIVHVVAQPATGIADFQLVPREGQKITSDALALVATRASERARAELDPAATFTLRNPTRRTAFLLPHLAGTSSAALQQMRALKRALDPDGVFAGGRFEEEL
jgi:glycolate oxidase FAD binding subunit